MSSRTNTPAGDASADTPADAASTGVLTGPQADSRPLLRLILVAAGGLLAVKVGLAGLLDLYSDEIFYWLASTRPAPAYSDLPFMTALLAGIGAYLGGENSLAVRSLFLLCGTLIPPLLFWLARPVVGRRMALEAAGLGLCLPLAGFMGLLAVPDAPLVVYGLLALGCLQRALDNDRWGWWLGAGLAMACGLSTHYRFLPLAGGILLFLLLCPRLSVTPQHPTTPQHPHRLLNPRLWMAVAVGVTGLLPMLWFNLEHQLGGLGFHLGERHPWRFQAEGLLHVFRQAGIVTPPLYALLWYTAWRLLQQARGSVIPAQAGIQNKSKADMTLDSPGLRNRRHGNDGDRETAALFLTAALVNLLPYLLLAPWADENSTSFHWPLLGYLPLLPFAPLALRHLYRLWLQRWGRAVAIRLAAGVPAIGFGGTLLALAVVGSQAFHHPLQDLFGTDVLSNKMAGWRAFTTHTRHLMQARFPAAPPVIITDNYYTAAQLEFAGFEPPIYTLDQNKAVRDGRAQQLHIWQRDEAALDRLTGRAALLITEDSTLRVLPREDVVRRACSRASRIDLISRLSLYRGDKIFSYYVIPRLTPRQPDLSRGSAPQSPPAIRCSR